MVVTSAEHYSVNVDIGRMLHSFAGRFTIRNIPYWYNQVSFLLCYTVCTDLESHRMTVHSEKHFNSPHKEARLQILKTIFFVPLQIIAHFIYTENWFRFLINKNNYLFQKPPGKYALVKVKRNAVCYRCYAL